MSENGKFVNAKQDIYVTNTQENDIANSFI